MSQKLENRKSRLLESFSRLFRVWVYLLVLHLESCPLNDPPLASALSREI